MRVLISIWVLISMILISGCGVEKFKAPDIKDDFCGAHINFQYCKCAFHNQYCESIGMSKSEANTYVQSAYDAWVKEQLDTWLIMCAASGGVPGKDDCTRCDEQYADKCAALEKERFGVIEKDGNLYLNSKPGQVLMVTNEDLPEWARGQIATVGAMISVVGPPDTVTEGDTFVLLDGLPVARVGDGTAHGGYIAEGSTNIFVNGKPVATLGSQAVDPTVNPGPVPRVGGPIVSVK